MQIRNYLTLSEMNGILVKHFIEQWQLRWQTSSSITHYKMNQRSVSLIYTCKLGRTKENIARRLRLGCVGLNVDLARMRIHPTRHCNSCPEPIETVEHYMAKCSFLKQIV